MQPRRCTAFSEFHEDQSFFDEFGPIWLARWAARVFHFDDITSINANQSPKSDEIFWRLRPPSYSVHARPVILASVDQEGCLKLKNAQRSKRSNIWPLMCWGGRNQTSIFQSWSMRGCGHHSWNLQDFLTKSCEDFSSWALARHDRGVDVGVLLLLGETWMV
jgi:hypothetical protein